MKGLTISLLMMIIATTHTNCDALLRTNIRSKHSDHILQIVMDLSENCLPMYQPTIGVAYHREMENDILRKLSKLACFTVIGCPANRDSNFETKPTFKKISKKKNLKGIERTWNVNAFLMIANSAAILHEVMKKLQNSIWWNPSGLFIAVETNPKTNGCKKALDYLWVIWSYGVLSSTYLCLDELDTPRIYTFNPYEDHAPSPWRRVHQSQSRNGHPWTLYQQEYKQGRVACNEVVFDRTRNLQGYPIRVNACPREPALYIHPSKTGLEKFSGEDGMIMTSVLQVLNATLLDINYFEDECEFRSNDEDGIYHVMLANVASKKVDICMNAGYLRLRKGLSSTYPHINSQLCFATKLKRTVSSWIIIESLFSNIAKSGIIVVFVVSMIVTKYFEGRSISDAFLDSIRLALNTTVNHLPKTRPGRFVGYAELLVLLVIHTVLTARLVSVLSKPITDENIDTMKELKSINYTLFALPIFRNRLEHLNLTDRFVVVNNSVSCFTKVIHGNMKQICMDDCLILETIAMHSNELHIGTYKLDNYFTAYTTSVDWPLTGRINVVIQRMVEAGLPNYWRSSTFSGTKHQHVYLLQNSMHTERSIVLFKNFKFTFRLFGMGLGLAIAIFILEIIVKFLIVN